MSSRNTLRWDAGVAVAGLGLALAGCAHGGPNAQPLRISVEPEAAIGETGMVSVSLTNVSNEDQCVRQEVLARPASDATTTQLRLDGREIAWLPEGYVLPQLAGSHPLPPAGSATFRLDVRGRHEIDGLQVGQGSLWELRVGVSSWPCATPTGEYWTLHWSDWTPLLPPGSPFPGS